MSELGNRSAVTNHHQTEMQRTGRGHDEPVISVDLWTDELVVQCTLSAVLTANTPQLTFEPYC